MTVHPTPKGPDRRGADADGRCQECNRHLLEVGARHRMEAAWDREDMAPAVEFIGAPPPSLALRDHLDDLATLAVRLEELCQHGRLRIPEQLNNLTDEIWELKAGIVRLPFFHVPGTSHGTTRATHGFVKNSQQTPPREIRRATAIMREDLNK